MFDPSLQTIWGGDLIAVFCDTGWEHPDTYKHVNDVCLQMGVRLITLKSKYDFVSLAVHKKRFPSTNARFCTSELKMKPMIDYVLSLKESCIIIQGIRAGESTARAAMEEECMYFKSYFQPNKKGRTENYRSKDVKEWCCMNCIHQEECLDQYPNLNLLDYCIHYEDVEWIKRNSTEQ